MLQNMYTIIIGCESIISMQTLQMYYTMYVHIFTALLQKFSLLTCDFIMNLHTLSDILKHIYTDMLIICYPSTYMASVSDLASAGLQVFTYICKHVCIHMHIVYLSSTRIVEHVCTPG